MKLTFRLSLVLVVIVFAAQSSCKKEDDDSPESSEPFEQKLVSKVYDVEGGDSTVYDFYYSPAETLDSVIITQAGGSYTRVFYHSSNLIVGIVPAFVGGGWVDSTWLDDAGRPVNSVKRIFNTAVEFRYVYNEAGELILITSGQPRGVPSDSTWNAWSNGNLVTSYSRFGDSLYYHYDESKSFQHGEARQIASLLEFGMNLKSGSNLQTGYTQDGIRIDYTLQLDDKGRLTRTSDVDGVSFLLIEYK